MPEEYFVDAWFFIALTDRRDSHHQQARLLARRMAGSRLTTHDGVFAEVLAYFSDEGPRARAEAAANVGDAIASIRVVPADRPLFLRALDRYERRPDKEYSLVDCMSMIVMEDLGIRRVLTNDRHFAQAGFTLVDE